MIAVYIRNNVIQKYGLKREVTSMGNCLKLWAITWTLESHMFSWAYIQFVQDHKDRSLENCLHWYKVANSYLRSFALMTRCILEVKEGLAMSENNSWI